MPPSLAFFRFSAESQQTLARSHGCKVLCHWQHGQCEAWLGPTPPQDTNGYKGNALHISSHSLIHVCRDGWWHRCFFDAALMTEYPWRCQMTQGKPSSVYQPVLMDLRGCKACTERSYQGIVANGPATTEQKPFQYFAAVDRAKKGQRMVTIFQFLSISSRPRPDC